MINGDTVRSGEINPVGRLEFGTFEDMQQLLIKMGADNFLHITLTQPSKGQGLLAHWNDNGMGREGYRPTLSTIGTRPYAEGVHPNVVPGETEQFDRVVKWGGVTYGDELVIATQEPGEKSITFTGLQVGDVNVINPPLAL